MEPFRIGRISSVNYADGTCRVVYNDKDKTVTTEIPLLCQTAREYFMPRVDDYVMVLHLSNGQQFGLILGMYWKDGNRPVESGEGLYRKDFDRDGKCYMRYDANSGELKIHCDGKIILEGVEGISQNASGGSIVNTAGVEIRDTAPAIHHN